jgi:hypothetical protein
MFTLHTASHLRLVRAGIALCWVLLANALAAQTQTQAACAFNFFSPTTPFKLPDGTPLVIQPLGINDFGTVVGYSSPGKARGLIRWANGGFTRVKGTIFLNARNDHGISVGLDLTGNAVLVGPTDSPTITPVDVNNSFVEEVKGINKWNTIVGRYFTGLTHGFKRWNNGTVHSLDFPGIDNMTTVPLGINDNGTVVGSYDTFEGTHGFIFHNGHWATLDYPHAVDTQLVGITNAGKIIGNAWFVGGFADLSRTLFLYENGIFKVISVPNSDPETRSLMSITPKQGLILGTTELVGSPAFIAQCQ